MKLKNRDLEIEITNLQGQLEETKEQIASLLSQLNAKALQSDPTEKVRLIAQHREAEVRKVALKAQLDLQMAKAEQLVRVSPIDGEVVTWDLKKNLYKRPVVTGQILVTVANNDSDWELELLMPEKNMKYIDEAIATSTTKSLPVEYIMLTDTSTGLKGTLTLEGIHRRAELDQEEGAVVKLRVKPDEVVKSKRAGAEVKADVTCGKASAAFVWFHPVIEWIYANVIF